MLKEIRSTHQRPSEPRRRWFTNDEFDLYVWQDEAGEVLAFQLCYDKSDDERVLFWNTQAGYTHAGIADARAGGSAARTPIFRADGEFDPDSTLTRLRVVRGDMDPGVFEFIHARLEEYGGRIDLPRGDWTEYSKG